MKGVALGAPGWVTRPDPAGRVARASGMYCLFSMHAGSEDTLSGGWYGSAHQARRGPEQESWQGRRAPPGAF